MGFAAGVLLALHGGLSFSWLWAGASSAILVSGPLQFLFVDWVRSGTAYADVAALVVCLNIRYSLYGLSLLDRFAAAPWPVRAYMIGTVTDETYALQVQCPYPPGPRSTRYCLLLAAFDHAYWIFGVVAGAMAGAALPFAAKGIDFAMTALFLVILTDQCRDRANRLPALVGAVSAIVAAVVLYFVFGSWKMLVPAMALIVASLLILRRRSRF
jgi:4-azaleucine resistance transporter AzlC